MMIMMDLWILDHNFAVFRDFDSNDDGCCFALLSTSWNERIIMERRHADDDDVRSELIEPSSHYWSRTSRSWSKKSSKQLFTILIQNNFRKPRDRQADFLEIFIQLTRPRVVIRIGSDVGRRVGQMVQVLKLLIGVGR